MPTDYLTVQSTDLIRFVMSISASPDGIVSLNTLDEEDQILFESDFFTPVYAITSLARRTRLDIRNKLIEEVNVPAKDHTLTRQILDSDVQTREPSIYVLCQIVTLESFALIYHLKEKPHKLLDVTPSELKRTRENINYLADYFSTIESYRKFIPILRNMDLSIGYIENQIPRLRKIGRRGGSNEFYL